MLGIAAVAFGLSGDARVLIAGVFYLAVAPLVWFAVPPARWAGMAVALIAFLPGIYGIAGLTVVAQQFISCQDGSIGSTASIGSAIFTSFPSNYCQIVDWTRQFGIGFALIGVGMAGIVILYALATGGNYFERRSPGHPR